MIDYIQKGCSSLRHLTLYALTAVLCFGASFACAQFGENPFSVAVELQTPTGAPVSLSVDFSVPAKHYLYAAQLAVTAEGAALTPHVIPPPETKEDPAFGDSVEVYAHNFQLIYHVAKNATFPLKVTVEYGGCNDSFCFAPEIEVFEVSPSGVTEGQPLPTENAAENGDARLSGFRITGRDAGFLKPPAFLAFLDRVEAGEGISENIVQGVFRKYGAVVMVLFVLLGGLLLNMTPCVLPMIPVNIAIIGAGSQAGSRSRGFALGATYGLGISLVYGILGLVVVLTGAQFGTLNSSPWFNLSIAILFAALSLAMFGVFNIDFSRFQSSGPSTGGRGSFITAFMFGGVAALLAGACVAPILIGVLVFSTEVYQRGSAAGLFLPFVLGLGMALPWPFAGAGLSFLPKPGQWMERVKIGFGVVILAAAVYYGHLGVRLLAPVETDEHVANPVLVDDFVWLTDLDEALAASRETGKPVFVDVWATWCKSCKAMSKTTLQDPRVLARLSEYVPLKFQAENPKDPNTKRVLDTLGVKGQPFYVVLQSK